MPPFASPRQIQTSFLGQLPLTKRATNAQAFWGADPQYYLPTREQVQQFLHHSLTLPATNLGTGFDCDDYAYAAKGTVGLWNRNTMRIQASWCVGVIFGQFSWVQEPHAANWFFDPNMMLWLFEPQDHQLHAFTDCVGQVKLILL